jgi:actin, other eukaryote
MAADQQFPVVVDCGSGFTRAGLAGGGDADIFDTPESAFPTVIGHARWGAAGRRPNAVQAAVSPAFARGYVGDKALEKRSILTLRYPVEHGMITNWEDAARIWEEAVTGVGGQERPLLLTESVQNPRAAREKTLEVCFESPLAVPRMSLVCRQSLALHATGSSTGLVVSVGESVMWVVPIVQNR